MKIPIVKATTDIPTGIPVTVRPETAGMEWGAVQGLGQQFQNLALQVSEEEKRFNDKKRQIDMADTIINTEIAASKINEETITELRKNPNPDTYYSDWEKSFVEARAEVTKGIQDPETKKRAEIAVKRMQLSESVQQKNYANQLWLSTKQADSLRQNDYFIESGNTEAAYDNLNRNIEQGVFDPKTAELERQRIRDKDKVEKEKKKREQEKLEDKVAETKADTILTAKHGKNYDKIIDELADPEKYSKLGLTAERAANLTGIISNRKIKEEKERKVLWDGTNRNFTILDVQDSLSRDMLREALELNSIDPVVAHGWDKRITEKVNAVKEGKDGKIETDYPTYSRLLSLAYSHPDKELVSKNILSNLDKLDDAARDRLLTINETKIHSTETQRISRGIDFIKGQVIPKRGMTAAFLSTPQEEKDLADALMAFDNQIAKAKATGKDLTAEQVDTYAREAAQSFTKTIPQRMMDFNAYMVGQMKKDAEVGKPGKKKTDKELDKILNDGGFETTPENRKKLREALGG